MIQDLRLVETEVQVVQVAVDLEEILLLELVDLQPRVKEMMEEMVLQEHLVVMKLVVAVEVTEQRVLMQVQVLVVMVEQEQILVQLFQLLQILEYTREAEVVAQVQALQDQVELEVVELEAL